jgi:outer membrane receptor protein involved in Fe transport
LTSFVDIQLQKEAIEGKVVVVIAEKKMVRVDVASSQKSISSESIAQLAVSSVSDVIGLQAGVSGFSVRGGSYNETMFMVDGIALSDERTSDPTTTIPLSSIQDISIQTGGFSAEYHNVRSGVVNVVTKEGSADHYSGSISFRNSSVGQKHFGMSPYDKDSFWNKPFFDDEVAWDGTENSTWDKYTQRQYPTFEGWNRVSEQTLSDSDPNNDLSPSGAQKLFTWEHRKNGAIMNPDFNIDAGFGGPVPFISKKLGNLRFFFSTMQEQDEYLYEVSRSGLNRSSSFLKLTSDLSKQMKITYSHLSGVVEGTTLSRGGGTSIMNDTWDLASQVNRRGFTMPWRLFTNVYWSPTKVNNQTDALKLSHQLSPRSYYKILIKRDRKDYYTWHGARRDTTKSNEVIDGYFVDDSPDGFWGSPYFSIEGRLAFGGAISTSRDTSKINTFTLKADWVSQVNSHNQVKAGFEFISSDLQLEYGSQNEFLPEGNYWTSMNQIPFRAAFYLQDKLEFKGFVANTGFNVDYVNPNGEWVDLDVYDEDFFSTNYLPENEDTFNKEVIKPRFVFSPRLAISHPITDVSKLYFNYGHYRQMPIAQDLYRIQRGNGNEVNNLGDPNLPLAKTISYELGYDHALDNSYLVHLSAYYKDISNQQDLTQYISANSKVIYYQLTANSYEDIRGFEVDISKVHGDWITGNVNYEYRVNTSGYYDVKKYFENPSDQREYIAKNPKQSKPRPIPKIKSILDLHTPLKFGPKIAGQYVLGDWHMNLISFWREGSWFTYNPNSVPGIEYNVQYKNNYNVDLKIAKSFFLGNLRVKLYADIYNAFNIKSFSGYGFEDGYDYNYYMQSLHMSDEIAGELGYHNFAGTDAPGDVRVNDADFVPMEWTSGVNTISEPSTRPIYYDNETEMFMQWTETGGWNKVEKSYYDRVIENKAYIDMPNLDHYIFLNPRDIFIGLNISYDF